jgi:NADP-dependent 3-hydroxy acid dehydrogenase YdfG
MGRGDRFQDQVVFVSGATSGIGWETARLFRDEGARVVGTGRDPDRLAALAGEIDLALPMDVTDDASVHAAVAAAVARMGRVDVLVNNAGIGLFKPWDETPVAEVHRIMDVNLYGVVRLTQAVLPAMVSRNQGVVVNVASVAGKRAYKKHTAYCASKHALIGYSEGLRNDLEGTAVSVVVVLPPAVRTPFFENSGYFTFDADHPGLVPMSAVEVARGIVEATAARDRQRILSLRAKVLYALSLVSPGGVDVLRRFK